MSKSTHFFGQPVYGQLIKCLDKNKINTYSRQHGGERYVKKFDMWLYRFVRQYKLFDDVSHSLVFI